MKNSQSFEKDLLRLEYKHWKEGLKKNTIQLIETGWNMELISHKPWKSFRVIICIWLQKEYRKSIQYQTF